MSNTLVVTIAGLITAIFWGAGDWLIPRSKKKLSTVQINLVVNFVGSATFLIVLAVSKVHWPDAHMVMEISGISLLLSVGYLCFVKALTIGSVGVVVPLSSIYPMFALILSIIFLNQSYKYGQIIAMVLIAMGAFLLAYEKNHDNLSLKYLHKATFFTITAVIVWGISFFFLNPLIPKVQWQPLLFILEFVGLLIALPFVFIVHKSESGHAIRRSLTNPNAVRASLILSIGTIALYMGAGRTGNIIIPAVLSSTSPLISATLSAIVDKEKLGVLKRLGAVIAIGGIVVLNLV